MAGQLGGELADRAGPFEGCNRQAEAVAVLYEEGGQTTEALRYGRKPLPTEVLVADGLRRLVAARRPLQAQRVVSEDQLPRVNRASTVAPDHRIAPSHGRIVGATSLEVIRASADPECGKS